MNRILTKLMPSFFLFLFTGGVFAAETGNLCPTIEGIKNNQVRFISAEGSSVVYRSWLLSSTSFKHKDLQWTIDFRVELLKAATSQEAISQGQTYFDTQVVLSNPISTWVNGKLICIYASTETGKPYYVAAKTNY